MPGNYCIFASLRGQKKDHTAFPLFLIENLKKIYWIISIDHCLWTFTMSISKCCIWKSNLSERESMKMIKRAVTRQNIKTFHPHRNKCMSCEYSMNNWTNISRGMQTPVLPGCWSRFGKEFVSHSTLLLQVEVLHMKGSEVDLWAI